MQYNIHLPYYNETFLYGYGFGIRVICPALFLLCVHSESKSLFFNNLC